VGQPEGEDQQGGRVKPKPAPASLVWHELPTFDQLLEQSQIKVAALRLRLADVPCWRCPDNTVRYEAEGAESAIAAVPSDTHPDAPDKPVTALSLLDKQIGINAAAAKQNVDTIKAMSEPLRAGVELWKAAWDRQETRLGKLEATFDRMLAVLEAGLTHQHERELAVKKQAAAVELRGKTLEVVKQQLPAIVSKWGLTKKAQLAVDLVSSLDPAMVQALIDSDVLTEQQTRDLQELRASVANHTPPTEQPKPPSGDDN
jgi:hypothetical protein